mgnify:CR=1 FL=1
MAVGFKIDAVFEDHDVVVSDAGVFVELHEAGVGVVGPKGEDVVAVAGEGVKELFPVLEFPDDGDGFLGGGAGVVVAGGAAIEGDVVFESAAEDVGLAGAAGDGAEGSAEVEHFGEFEAAVHEAEGVAAEDDEGGEVAGDDAEGLGAEAFFVELEADGAAGVVGLVREFAVRVLEGRFKVANGEGDFGVFDLGFDCDGGFGFGVGLRQRDRGHEG